MKIRTVISKGDTLKVLAMFRKRLEKYLEILQHTRHFRILSSEERNIKDAIEVDLDEIDKALQESGQRQD